MARQRPCVGLWVLLLVPALAHAQNFTVEVRQRMYADLLTLDAPLEIAPESASFLAAALQSNGSWANIDYNDRSAAAWQPNDHLRQMLKLAQAYRDPSDSLYNDPNLLDKIHAAYNFWVSNDFTSNNWWYNQIGSPRRLGRTMILMHDTLTPAQIHQGVTRLSRSTLTLTGQNLVWQADVVAMRAAITENSTLMSQAFNAAANVVQLAPGAAEGIKFDYSFYQHGTKLYNGGYGLSFASDITRLASQADGLPYAFSDQQIAILTNYLLDGQQWMVRGQTVDASVRGRELAREDTGQVASLLYDQLSHMLKTSSPRLDELQAFQYRLSQPLADPQTALVGNKHFFKGDYMAHHRPDFFMSVRMHSSRTTGNETINGENLRGYYTAEGVTFLHRRGDEYTNIYPILNWRQLPGITAEQRPTPPGGAPSQAGSSVPRQN